MTGLKIAFYGGIGKSDIHIVAILNKVEDLFLLNSTLRSLSIKRVLTNYDLSSVLDFTGELEPEKVDFPIFHRIDSDLLVSIQEESQSRNFGDVEVKITVKGNSISEKSLDYFSDNFSKLATTNGNKWVTSTNKPVSFTILLKEVLTFRQKLSERDGGECFSKTTFISNLENNRCEQDYTYDFSVEQRELNFPSLNSLLNNFGASEKELYNATEDLIQKYSTLFENNLFRRSIQDIENFIHLLATEQNEIVENLEVKDSKGSTQVTEAHQAISVAVDAISQRLEHRYNIHIKAVTKLLISLSVLAKEHIDYKGLSGESLVWKGFVFVSRVHGYSLKPFEIYTIPHVSVNQPLSSNVNWHSLTHEMSHWIFDELNLSYKYHLIVEESIKRMGIIASGKHLKHEKNRYDQLIYEYFATWFDYYHFYNEEQLLFQLHIWRSWSSLSFTEDKISEYLSRSFLVYLFQKKGELIEAYFEDAEKEYISKQFKLFTLFIKEQISPKIQSCIFDQVNKFEASNALEISRAVIPIFINTLDEYCFEQFRKNLHSDSAESAKCVETILNGEIYTDQLKNPFIIINKLLKHLSENEIDDQTLWKLETALLFSIGAQVG